MPDCKNCGPGRKVPSQGTILEVKSPVTGEYVLVCGMSNLNGPNSTRGEMDGTDLCSTAKEFVLDLPDYGTIEGSGFLMYGNEGQGLLAELFTSAEETEYRLTLPDDGYKNGPVLIEFSGYVQSMPITAAQSAILSVSFTIRITGAVKVILPTSLGSRLAFDSLILNEDSANDGTVTGTVTATLTGDTFTGADGSPLAGVTFTNTPAGLTASAVKTDATTATISFGGTATNHAEADSAQVVVSFGDAAFTTGPASAIGGTSNRQITINFED